MPENEYSLAKITGDDMDKIELLASEKDGNKNLTKEFIQHWYFNNPSHSFSLWKVVVNKKTEGFATTNNFKYIINNKEVNVAMPQNVLTSERIRGKGFFNKLYFKTEQHNIDENNIDAFLTFTNASSTPIFLKKFNYLKGKCPVVIFSFFSIKSFFQKKNFERLHSTDQIESRFFNEKFCFDNSMQKNETYYKWRYSNYKKDKLHIIKVFDKQNVIGFAFLKEEKKKGGKFLIVMDIITPDPRCILKIIQSCFMYSSRKFYAGTMVFELPSFPVKKRIFLFKIKNRFNFLVKGKSNELSESLSSTDFNMYFGDLDIV